MVHLPVRRRREYTGRLGHTMGTSGTAAEGVRERFTGDLAVDPQELTDIFNDARSTIDSYRAGMEDTQLAYAVRDVAQSVECRIELLPDQLLPEKRLWLGALEHDLGDQLLTLGAELESVPVMLEAAKRYASAVSQARQFMHERWQELESRQTEWVVELFAKSADQFLQARDLVVQAGDAPRYADLTAQADQMEEERLAMSRLISQAEESGSAAPGTAGALDGLERSIAAMRARGA